MNFSKGFTLLEVLVAILIMGLASTGLLQLLTYGTWEYNELSRAWRRHSAVSSLRQACRNAVMQGNAGTLNNDFAQKILSCFDSGIYVKTLDIRPAYAGLWFVQVKFYEDKNKNGRLDAGESLPVSVWCFRERGSRS